VAEADCIINLPKLKTHTLTQLTGALKNPYGYIPGFLKATLHTLAPAPAGFVEILCALWEVLPPAFTLLDAVVAMEGQGPSAGQPRAVGWILGGTDPLAIDSIAAQAMGFALNDIHLLREAQRRGLGIGRLEEIALIGGSPEALRIPGFQLPVTSRLERWAPRWLARFLGSLLRPFLWVRPHVLAEACEMCHRCVRSCPTGAMQAEAGAVPQLAAPRDCISCLCCQEVCPARAIAARKSLIVTRLFESERRKTEAAAGTRVSQDPPLPDR
jgi:ferredoxin